MKSHTQILKELTKAFPDCWFKPGVDFDGNKNRAVWSGEGSYIDGLDAFNYYWYDEDPKEEIWIMGVNRKLHDFVDTRGFYWECYDGGTYMLYRK